jgi:hypothetical protein
MGESEYKFWGPKWSRAFVLGCDTYAKLMKVCDTALIPKKTIPVPSDLWKLAVERLYDARGADILSLFAASFPGRVDPPSLLDRSFPVWDIL